MKPAHLLLPICLSLVAAACGDRDDGARDGTPHAGDHMHDSVAPHHATGMHAAPGATEAHATRIEVTTAPSPVRAGEEVTFRIAVIDTASGEPVDSFEISHEKRLHLIVVSSDLTWFNHLHPTYEGEGRFTVRTRLPRPGTYRLFADYRPQGSSGEVASAEIVTQAASATAAEPSLTADHPGSDGWIVREVAARPEGEPDAAGSDAYRVALMPMPSPIVAGQEAMLHFEVRDAQDRRVDRLEPYLGAMGHAVILSADGRRYLHAHPQEGGHRGEGAMMEQGGTVVFHTLFEKPGLYRVWGEFSRNGRIITAPFTLEVAPAGGAS